MTKKVLVICGTGIATSTVVVDRLRDHLAASGIDADIVQGKVLGGLEDIDRYDIVVSTTQLPHAVPVPVVNGTPFLTGIGLDDTLQEVVAALQ